MASPQQLLARLKALGDTLASTGRALALIGLGSAGSETQRLDQFSDLDFFVIASPAAKPFLLDDLSWLAAPAPLAYVFRNTPDGYKVLSADNVFYEFAIFEPTELSAVPYVASRVVWQAADIDSHMLAPGNRSGQASAPPLEWLMGEALTNLYVGLGRFHRGEKLSAMRFIQQYAVDRVVELAARLEAEATGECDPFAPERRFERRFPLISQQLPQFLQGYERSPESARAIVDFLEQHIDVDSVMVNAIRARC